MKKRRKQRILAVSTAICLLLSLSGCMSGTQPDEGQGGETDTSSSGGTYYDTAEYTEEQLTAVREDLQDSSRMEGLGEVTKMEFYENGVRTGATEMNQQRDNKILYYSGDIKRVVNYADGYAIDIPQDWEPDYSLSPIKVEYTGEEAMLTITVEDVFEADVEYQLEQWVNRHLLNQDWQRNNKITQLGKVETREVGEFTAQIIRMQMKGMEADNYDYFTYVNLYSPVRTVYYRLVFKSYEPLEGLDDIVNSFQRFSAKGQAVYNKEYHVQIPEDWTEETRAVYDRMRGSQEFEFGMYQSNLDTAGYDYLVPAFEERTNYTMDILATYIHSGKNGGTLDWDFYDQLYEDGKMLQISYQFTANNNTDLNGYSPLMDIYRGKMDDELRSFARQIKEFGHTVFFRLNNEMCTDWCSYSAIANMADPYLFVVTWERMYKIFQEEGATPYMIWSIDTYMGSYPPGNWSKTLNYIPSTECFQMIALTNYTGGNGGTFTSCKEMFETAIKNVAPFFQDDEWPMCIGEFSCGSGVNGNQTEQQYQWVEQMMSDFKELPQIKYGIWFNANDYNADGITPLNYYGIDIRDKGLLEAFRKGFAAVEN